MFLFTALIIGFVGSAHCLGMCAPVFAAVNRGKNSRARLFQYSIGRIAMYAILGGVAGGIGRSFDILGEQQVFSMAMGTVILAGVLSAAIGRKFHRFENLIGRVVLKISGWIRNSRLTPLQVNVLSGMANGLLPCGLVYLAMAAAANTFTPWHGALFMIAFGLGTIPALWTAEAFSNYLFAALKSRSRILIPIMLMIVGGLLFVRGSNLGIPIMSPKTSDSTEITACE